MSSTSPSRRSPRAAIGAPSPACPIATLRGAIRHNRPRAIARKHGRTAVRDAGLQARPDHRELLHRLSQASLHVALYRPRLQIALHLLPVAADRRRPSLPHAQRRPCRRRDPLGEGGVSAGQGILLRRRHLHRRPAAQRSDRARARQARRHLVLQRQGQRAARRSRSCATTACACCWSATKPAISRSCTTSRRACASTWRGASPRIATTSASPFTAPSSSACPARPARPSRRPSTSPRRSTRTRSRSRSRRPIPGTELYREALEHGWLDQAHAELVDDERRADRAAALSASRPIPKFSSRSRSSTAASTSARRRSPRSSAEMVRSPEMMMRRLREGVEFFSFLRERREFVH